MHYGKTSYFFVIENCLSSFSVETLRCSVQTKIRNDETAFDFHSLLFDSMLIILKLHLFSRSNQNDERSDPDQKFYTAISRRLWRMTKNGVLKKTTKLK